MSFRTTIEAISPSWLLGENGKAFMGVFGQMLDNLMLQLKDGIKARFPEYAPDDALGYIGHDRTIERGPLETAVGYKARLRQAVPSNKKRGSPGMLLTQLAGFFSGTGQPSLRLVSYSPAAGGALWFEYDWTTGLSTRTVVNPQNWNWDYDFTKWHRGWVVIDGSALGWTSWSLGEGITMGDGHTFGSSAPQEVVAGIRSVVQKWKPANVYAVKIIVTFTSGILRRTDAAPPNPDGDWDVSANRDPGAVYWASGGEEP